MISPPNTVDPPASWTPSGHPIRWFVLAVAVVAIGCVVCWWAALLNPRLSSSPTDGSWNFMANEGSFSFDLRNDAVTAFEVRSVVVNGPGSMTTGVYVDGEPVVADVRVVGGEVVSMNVTFRLADCSQDHSGDPTSLDLTVITVAGIERTQRLPMGAVRMSTPCGEISRSTIPGEDR